MTESFLWNYLDDPPGLPHPAYAYWMPMAALLAALGMKLSGIAHFTTARLGFLVTASFIPPFTAYVAHTIHPERWAAVLAGILACFPVFYLRFLPTTDTFGIYMLLGGGFYLIVSRWEARLGRNSKELLRHSGRLAPPWLVFTTLLGIVAGLMHLTRADGLMWLFTALLVSLIFSSLTPEHIS